MVICLLAALVVSGAAIVASGIGAFTQISSQETGAFHMLAMSFSILASTERNGSLHSTVR